MTPVYITDYGAIGDGSAANATVNTSALNTALATGRPVVIPWTALGFNFGTNTITIPDGATVQGENHVVLLSTSSNLFYCVGNSRVSTLDNFTVDMNGSPSTSTAIRFATNNGVIYRHRLQRLRFINCVEAIGDDHNTGALHYLVDLTAEDINCALVRGRQIYLTDTRGFIYFRDTSIDLTYNTSLVNYETARFENFAGLELTRFDIFGFGTGTPSYTAFSALTINGNPSSGLDAAVWLDRVFVDTGLGHGITINNVLYLQTDFVESSLNLGNGITLYNVDTGLINNTFTYGAKANTAAAAGGAGLLVHTCKNLVLNNTLIRECTGSGVLLYNTTDTAWSNLQSYNNNYGFYEYGGTLRNVKTGGHLHDNSVANLFQESSTSKFCNYYNSGTFTVQT